MFFCGNIAAGDDGVSWKFFGLIKSYMVAIWPSKELQRSTIIFFWLIIRKNLRAHAIDFYWRMHWKCLSTHEKLHWKCLFCFFYTCKCLEAEIQLKKAIFMIHFRQLFARTNSNFMETFIEKIHYCSI